MLLVLLVSAVVLFDNLTMTIELARRLSVEAIMKCGKNMEEGGQFVEERE